MNRKEKKKKRSPGGVYRDFYLSLKKKGVLYRQNEP